LERVGAFPRLYDGEEPELLAELRETFYTQARSIAETVLTTARTKTFEKDVDSIAQFVRSAWCTEERLKRSNDEIPTAMVKSGINVADNLIAFDMLKQILCQPIYVKEGIRSTVISPKDTMNLKSLMRAITLDICGTSSSDIDDLILWYDEHETQVQSLVIVIPEFESAEIHAFSHLIRILSSAATLNSSLHSVSDRPVNQSKRLPFTFVLGIASFPEVVQKNVDFTALAALHISYYQLSKAKQLLDSVFRSLFFDAFKAKDQLELGTQFNKLGMKLSGPIIDWILSRFHYFTYSVSEIARSIYYALMDFYFSNPLSCLAVAKNRENVIRHLTTNHLEHIRSLPSVVAHLNQLTSDIDSSLPPVDKESSELTALRSLAIDLLSNDEVLKTHILQWLNVLERHHVQHACAVLIVHQCQSVTKISHRSLAYLYGLSLEDNLVQDEDVQLMLKLTR
jgi:hypothetical protein